MTEAFFPNQHYQVELVLVSPSVEKKERKSRKQEFEPFQMTWFLLERILKHYYEFKSLQEQEGINEVTLDNGVVVNVFDILEGLDELPENQRQAISLTCLQNLKEVEAARVMFPGSPWSSQVGTLKRQGLVYLVSKYWS